MLESGPLSCTMLWQIGIGKHEYDYFMEGGKSFCWHPWPVPAGEARPEWNPGPLNL